MTIQAYINGTGMQFWQYRSILVVMGIAEGLLFGWYAGALVQKEKSSWMRIVLQGILMAVCVALQFLHSTVLLHCGACLLIWSLFLIGVTHCDWKKALYYSSMFCLGMELAKLFCRDGFLTLILIRVMPYLSDRWLHITEFFVYLLLLTLAVALLRMELKRFGTFSISGVHLFCMLFPLFLYLVVRQMEFNYIEQMTTLVWFQIEILQLAIAGCAEIVITSTGHMLAVEKERNELLKKEMLFEKRQQQYLIQKETIRAVNRKYHDLKHYIAGFEAMNTKNVQDMEGYIDALKKEIEPFECIQKTGNEVMDILLYERMEECQKKGIRLVPFVDGRSLSFLHTMDLCAIFGNAMDNAIEATERVKYVNMREISLKIGVSGDMLLMRFQNYYDGTLLRQGEKLLSSKKEKEEHGYGLENIQMIVEKYGGTIASDADEHEFSLHILIPLPQEDNCSETSY